MRRPAQSGLCLLAGALAAVSAAAAQEVQAPHNPAPLTLPHDPEHAGKAATWCALHLGKRELAFALSDCNYAVAANPRSAIAYSNRGKFITYCPDVTTQRSPRNLLIARVEGSSFGSIARARS